jgi:MinD superfamily P-loop ATPase
MKSVQAGQWFRSNTNLGNLFHAELEAGAGVSGKLVSTLRDAGERWAQNDGVELMIIDGPPGIGCPVRAACTGVDLALIVTEPTLSGLADLKRILAVTEHFKIPALVCVNKADLNPKRMKEIEDYCAAGDIELLPELIYDQVVPQAMAEGLPVTEYTYSKIYHEIEHLWGQVDQRLEALH